MYFINLASCSDGIHSIFLFRGRVVFRARAIAPAVAAVAIAASATAEAN